MVSPTHLFHFVSSLPGHWILVGTVRDVQRVARLMLGRFVTAVMIVMISVVVRYWDWNYRDLGGLLELRLLQQVHVRVGSDLFLQSNSIEVIAVAALIRDWWCRYKDLRTRFFKLIVHLNYTICPTEVGEQEKSEQNYHQK